MKKTVIAAIALMVSGLAMDAKVNLPSVISDNMVLQQQTSVALWGTASPGKKVTVQAGWSRNKVSATADKSTGRWMISVNTPEAGGPYDIVISDGESVTLHNVLVGEVWFCSGQSNMEMPMKGYPSQPSKGATGYILSADPSRPLRVCGIEQVSSFTPLDSSEGSWKENTPEAVADISATAYYFAERLQSAIGVPVGIIVSCWGGSSIETWIPREYIEAEYAGEFDLSYFDANVSVKGKNQDPSLLFNGQVAPLVPYTFRGMIWYQGETNRGRPEQYIRLQETYARAMREIFKVPDAPFYFVQIAPYPYGHPDDWTSGYFVEAQQKSLKVIPHSGMAVTCDAGEYGTIHPCRKEDVGHRLAYLALAHDYGFTWLEADAPTYKEVEFKEGKAIVSFNCGPLGLSPINCDLPGFEIAGEDRVFHPAKATLPYGSSVVVESPEVAEPVAVRYCFRNWCCGGLFNNFGVPVAPFRTDDWSL